MKRLIILIISIIILFTATSFAKSNNSPKDMIYFGKIGDTTTRKYIDCDEDLVIYTNDYHGGVAVFESKYDWTLNDNGSYSRKIKGE